MTKTDRSQASTRLGPSICQGHGRYCLLPDVPPRPGLLGEIQLRHHPRRPTLLSQRSPLPLVSEPDLPDAADRVDTGFHYNLLTVRLRHRPGRRQHERGLPAPVHWDVEETSLERLSEEDDNEPHIIVVGNSINGSSADYLTRLLASGTSSRLSRLPRRRLRRGCRSRAQAASGGPRTPRQSLVGRASVLLH